MQQDIVGLLLCSEENPGEVYKRAESKEQVVEDINECVKGETEITDHPRQFITGGIRGSLSSEQFDERNSYLNGNTDEYKSSVTLQNKLESINKEENNYTHVEGNPNINLLKDFNNRTVGNCKNLNNFSRDEKNRDCAVSEEEEDEIYEDEGLGSSAGSGFSLFFSNGISTTNSSASSSISSNSSSSHSLSHSLPTNLPSALPLSLTSSLLLARSRKDKSLGLIPR